MQPITLRPLTTIEECLHFQELERRVWAADGLDIMPVHVLITIGKNGGGVIGAFTPAGPPEMGGLVGVTLWWLGTDPTLALPASREGTVTPKLKACSHMAGVLPAWQGRGVGLLLKLEQRRRVLEQGLTDWVTWTYDPLYRANGVFNIHRLGATCNTYYENLYGEMTDALNAGAPSDRCQVDWWLQSERVLQATGEGRPETRESTPILNLQSLIVLSTRPSGEFRQPVERAVPLDGAPLAIPIPADIGALRRHDPQLGLVWRFYLRAMLTQAFAAGYSMVDCLQLKGEWWYILNYENKK